MKGIYAQLTKMESGAKFPVHQDMPHWHELNISLTSAAIGVEPPNTRGRYYVCSNFCLDLGQLGHRPSWVQARPGCRDEEPGCSTLIFSNWLPLYFFDHLSLLVPRGLAVDAPMQWPALLAC